MPLVNPLLRALLTAAVCIAAQPATAEPNAITDVGKARVFTNQTYNPDVDGRAGLCDVYVPKAEAPDEGRAAVVVIHGGAWMSGDKWMLQAYCQRLARHGIVAIAINYRLAPKHKFPCQVDDVRQALIWTAENADQYAIDLDRLGVFGYSAGGHLAAMVGTVANEQMEVRLTTSNWAADDGRWNKLPSVAAMCLGGAWCNCLEMPIDNTTLAYFLGGSRRNAAEAYKAASPRVHASAGDPIAKFIHGDSDFLVPQANALSLYRPLKAAGVDVRFTSMPDQGHMTTFMNTKTQESVLEFFQNVFVKPTLSNWNMAQLADAPAMKWVDEQNPIRELTYQGLPVSGKPTDVFAFYATPGSIAGDLSKDKNLPAVVLIHGGGGTAFAEWVWKWAKRGYAAIAMDLSGRRPESPKFENGELISNMRAKRTRLPRGGLEQNAAEKFASVGEPIDDDWPYHAVANSILAHSLVRSFDEVDAERTAVTGISWGGYTTCIVASIDDRFKAAVPVYGCGFLYNGESVQRAQIDALPKTKRHQWIEQYDPSSHLRHCQVPMLFVNGTNDKHYPLPSYSKSLNLVLGEKQIRIEPGMRHSHQAGWEPEEIGLFIDSKLRGGKPLASLSSLRKESDRFIVDHQSQLSLKSAEIHFTNDEGPLVNRKWQSRPAEIRDKTIAAEAPKANTILFTVTDERGALVSSDVWFAEASD